MKKTKWKILSEVRLDIGKFVWLSAWWKLDYFRFEVLKWMPFPFLFLHSFYLFYFLFCTYFESPTPGWAAAAAGQQQAWTAPGLLKHKFMLAKLFIKTHPMYAHTKEKGRKKA